MARPERFHLVDGKQVAWTEDDWVAWEAEQEAADKDFTFIRSIRDAKLRDSDWTRLDDNGLSDSKKAEWATHRQALRDYPASASKVSELGAWPTEPS